MDIESLHLKPPIGFSDFRELRQAEPKRLYVDKSRFIAEVLRDDAKVLLFPRPRRFGKTLNLSMLRYFLEKYDQDLSEIFSDLVVWNDPLSRRHFQQYPTIFVTFKDIKERSFELTFEGIREVIRQVYHEHREILDSPALTAEQKDRYRLLLRSEGSEIIVRRALLDLTEYLSVTHNRQVILLIDEYDTPIQQGFLQGFYDEAVDFFRNFYAAALKDNVYLFRGVLSGILRVARESLFSGLNNLVVRSLLDPEYATSFGFTEEETLRITGAAQQTEIQDNLKYWYDGYQFGGQVIYNPWSILRYLETRRFEPYWVSTGSDDLLYERLSQRGADILPEVDALLRGETLSKRIDVNLSLRDMNRNPDIVWNFLLFSGYLKPTASHRTSNAHHIDLAIPNQEVKTAFENVFRKWISHQLQGDHLGPVLLEALTRGDAPEVEQLLSTLMQSASIHDVARRPENFYHGIILGILRAFTTPYEVRSNRESGYGRPDVLISPPQADWPGVVLEFKAIPNHRRDNFEPALHIALQQMREQDYAAELRAVGAQPIHEFAVVFAGKRVRVRHQEAPATGANAVITAAVSETDTPGVTAFDNPFYIVGALAANAISYVQRQSDQELMAFIKDTPLIAVYGDDEVGKSSLLIQACSTLQQERNRNVILQNLTRLRTDDESMFIHQFFQVISEKLGDIHTWDALTEGVKQHGLILLLDEFDALSPLVTQAFVPRLYFLANEARRSLRVVVTLSETISTFLNNQGMTNPKYSRDWCSIHVTSLDLQGVDTLLRLLPETAYCLVSQYQDMIMKRSLGHPRSVQCLCAKLFNATLDGQSEDQLSRMIENEANYR